jgi:hypothetical protein
MIWLFVRFLTCGSNNVLTVQQNAEVAVPGAGISFLKSHRACVRAIWRDVAANPVRLEHFQSGERSDARSGALSAIGVHLARRESRSLTVAGFVGH